ncbi:MAG: stage II sporulation protein D [Clostridia bacterium]|nr:stage II sporulation protein D [Clostridia bacterium]
MVNSRRKKYIKKDIAPYIIVAAFITLLILLIRGFLISSDKESYIKKNAQHYKDVEISVYLHREKEARIMNMEEYLVGVVAAEMPVSFEKEALKAQAVAARTFTVRHIESLGGNPCKKDGCDVCSDSTCCQAYRSEAELYENWGDEYQENIKKITDAVYETRGEIIAYDGQPIEALYHSNSGGMTEAAVNVFLEARPYLLSVESPDREDAHGTKSVSFTKSEFVKRINKKWSKANLNERNLEKSIEIVSRYEGGRIEKIRLSNVTVSGKDMRKLFSLESANFTLEFTDKKVIVTTYGYGHGVGMSQYGANSLAKEGKTYSQILMHYYTDTEIITI